MSVSVSVHCVGALCISLRPMAGERFGGGSERASKAAFRSEAELYVDRHLHNRRTSDKGLLSVMLFRKGYTYR